MIALDPLKRISMKEALTHPYFNDITAEDYEKYVRNWYTPAYLNYHNIHISLLGLALNGNTLAVVLISLQFLDLLFHLFD